MVSRGFPPRAPQDCNVMNYREFFPISDLIIYCVSAPLKFFGNKSVLQKKIGGLVYHEIKKFESHGAS